MQNTGEDWDQLLQVLTDEELKQYGQMALDQVALENRWAWAQAGLALVAVAVAGWGVWTGFKSGFGFGSLYWLVPLAIAIYWPYRSARTRRLWNVHFKTVNGELVRRKAVKT